MHFSTAFAALAIAAVAVAQSSTLKFTNTDFGVTVGQPFDITYTATDLGQAATILLRKGTSTDLDTVETITTDATGGSYSWTPGNLTSASDYALEITQGSEINYSEQFSITGGSAATATYPTTTAAPAYYSSAAISSAIASGMPSYNATTIPPYATGNGTVTAGPTASGGVISSGGIPASRNATFSRATIPAPVTTVTLSGSTVTGSSPASVTSSSSSTNGASSLGSSVALVFGMAGALVYFN